MRLWVPPEQRKPDPLPLRTDDRAPALVGTVAWVVALVVGIAVAATGAAPSWLWTAVAGVAVGVVLLAYTQLRRRRG